MSSKFFLEAKTDIFLISTFAKLLKYRNVLELFYCTHDLLQQTYSSQVNYVLKKKTSGRVKYSRKQAMNSRKLGRSHND